MVSKMSALSRNPFLQNFKTLKFLYDLIFDQVHPMNTYFIEGDMYLLYKKFETNYMTLCIPFDYFF